MNSDPREFPDDDGLDDFDHQDSLDLLIAELADFSDSWARTNEDGWFYSDDD